MWPMLLSLCLVLSRKSARKTPPRRRPAFRRPRLEALEDRTLPSAYVVTTTADSGPGSLRDAINQINADTGHTLYPSPSSPSADEIDFAITAASDTGGGYNSATGVATIAPLSALPTINNAVLIDGYTQPGASSNTLVQGDNALLKIQLNLSAMPAGSGSGLYLNANNSLLRGLVVNGEQFIAPAIYVGGAGDHVEGNFIGTDVTGTQYAGNGNVGIAVAGPNTVVGGTTPDARNIISGNFDGVDLGSSYGSTVEGNYIGTDIAGTKPIGNYNAGVGLGGNTSGNTIGGTTAAARNIISGNGFAGVLMGGSGYVVEGNYIGTDVFGSKALGNGKVPPGRLGGGIFLSGAVNNTITNNVISGNGTLSNGPSGGIVAWSNGNPNDPNSGNIIQGNLIGTDATGTTTTGSDGNSLGNSNTGVAFTDTFDINNVIGGTTPGAGNTIAASAESGVAFWGTGNVIQGNAIVHNGQGVWVMGSNNTVGGPATGAGNTIAYNGGVADNSGVFVGNGATGVSILGDSIYANTGLGIDLANGANDNQAAPVLTAAYAPSGATIALGTITGTPGATVRVEFFANAAGDPEGRTLLGSQSVTTDASGHGSFTAFLSALPAGQTLVTATVTDPDGNTSEFSAGVAATPLPPSSLSGVVWEDFNDDGQVDFGENGIGGVTITLAGTDFLGNAVNQSQTTDGDGAYVFPNLYPGNYTLTETPPTGYTQGIDSVGTAGGSVSGTDELSVALGVGGNGLNYNFGEQPPAGSGVHHGQTAGIGFWSNKSGQALIKALNGGAGTQLADWLAATLPNTFGANAGSNDVAGQSNASIAALFQQDFVMKGVRLDAQVLATALSVYATNATLDPTKEAAFYGFTVSGDGAGTATANVGSNGDAFGVASNTTLTLMDLLLAADAQAVNGVLYNGSTTRRNEANAVFSAVNQAGGL